MAIFKGAGVAIATPFKDNGEINYEEFGRLIEFQIENGTDAIIVCGTTGEAATMTEEEHMEALRRMVGLRKVFEARVREIWANKRQETTIAQ